MNKKYSYEIISSSSKGNAILLNNYFLLDCGVTYSKLKPYIKKLKVIFISHEHSDHFNKRTIKKLAYEKPNIKYIVGYNLGYELLACGVPMKNIFVLDLDKWFDLGSFKVKLQMLYHDTPNNCIHIDFDGYKVFYATDTSSIDHIQAIDYDFYSIEGNYTTDEELREKIVEEKKEGKFSYLERVKDTHLSQLQALNWLQKNMGENSQYELIHKHIEKEVKDE